MTSKKSKSQPAQEDADEPPPRDNANNDKRASPDSGSVVAPPVSAVKSAKGLKQGKPSFKRKPVPAFEREDVPLPTVSLFQVDLPLDAVCKTLNGRWYHAGREIFLGQPSKRFRKVRFARSPSRAGGSSPNSVSNEDPEIVQEVDEALNMLLEDICGEHSGEDSSPPVAVSRKAPVGKPSPLNSEKPSGMSLKQGSEKLGLLIRSRAGARASPSTSKSGPDTPARKSPPLKQVPSSNLRSRKVTPAVKSRENSYKKTKEEPKKKQEAKKTPVKDTRKAGLKAKHDRRQSQGSGSETEGSKRIESQETPKGASVTPSRLSRRLMLKKDKFDVKKMLRGADLRNRAPVTPSSEKKPIVSKNKPLINGIGRVVKTVQITEEDKLKLLSALADDDDSEVIKPETGKNDFPADVDDTDIFKEMENSHEPETKEDSPLKKKAKTIPKKRQFKPKVNPVAKKKRLSKGNFSPVTLSDTESIDGTLSLEKISQLIIKRKSVSSLSDSQDSPAKSKAQSRWLSQNDIIVEPLADNPSDPLSKVSVVRVKMNKPSGDGDTLAAPEDVSRVRKTAKVTPMTQAKVDSPVRRSTALGKRYGGMDKARPHAVKSTSMKPMRRFNKLGNLSPIKIPYFDDSFDRYFKVSQRMIEHNDSFDSDVSDDPDLLSHFVDLKRAGKAVGALSGGANPKPRPGTPEQRTVYDLMNEISLEIPSWNIHILADSNTFCLAKISRGPLGIPVLKKTIELDVDYSAKVYVNQTFQSDLCGVYDSYDSIRQLIYEVDRL